MSLSTETSKDAASAALQASAAEAPHMLPRYTEPKPFVSGRALKAFGASTVIAFGCAAGFYRLLAKSLTTVDLEQERAASQLRQTGRTNATGDIRGGSSAFVGFDSTEASLPRFTAPTSFAQLSAMPPTELSTGAHDGADSKHRPLLHQEAITRMRVSWNTAVDACLDFVVNLETRRTAYLHDNAIAGVRYQLESRFPVYDFALKPSL